MSFWPAIGTYLAAKKLGWSHIAAVEFRGGPKKLRGYAIADNRTAELAEWDCDLLLELLSEMKTNESDLFDALLLAELLPEVPVAVESDIEHLKDVFQVVVECKSEEDQKRVFREDAG